MKVSASSRYARSYLVPGRRPHLSDYAPYRYHPHADNIEHIVTQSDTMPALAGRYFAPIQRACGLWWIIADYQPQPIIDPLVPLHVDYRRLFIPSLRVVTDIILRGNV